MNTEYTGLNDQEVSTSLKNYGKNVIIQKKKKGIISLILSQFKDVMVLILIGASVLSAVMGEVYDAITMVAIVLIDAMIGFFQELKTEKTIEAMKEMTAPLATVIRNGERKKIHSQDLVVGDIIYLEAGDKVHADAKILEENDLFCDESMLTGESEPVKKDDYTYMGSCVTKGNAVCEIISIGMNTKMGQVSKMIDSAGEDETPLQIKMGKLGKLLSLICIFICIAVVIAGLIRGNEPFKMLLLGISIAIAAIPEGLPATVTIALTLSVRRMIKINALIQKLHSIEALGSTTVICSDKTGTLTTNEMRVESVVPVNTYSKDLLYRCAVLCNDSSLEGGSNDFGEIALLKTAKEEGFTKETLSEFKRIYEEPFDSKKKMMSVEVLNQGNKFRFEKGAPDVIIKNCNSIIDKNGAKKLSRSEKDVLYKNVEEMCKDALRVMAFCFTDDSGNKYYLGVMGLRDPERKEARSAIKEFKRAGIKVIMITGDHMLTAKAIAKRIGIPSNESSVMSGDELKKISDIELSKRVKSTSIFARVAPEDKLRIVKALKDCNETVTFLGDGVNDAAAIKEADVGVAIGDGGTQVSKEASDLILLDNDLATLSKAIKEGRGVFSNIRKMIRYLISCNIGEVLVTFLSTLLGMPMVLLPTQILLVNLVTDGLPSIALGLEKPDNDIMSVKPKTFTGSFFSDGLLARIFLRGILISLSTLAAFIVFYRKSGIEVARTASLCTLVFSQLVHVFECRSEKKINFHILENKALAISAFISFFALMACIYIPKLSGVMQTVALSLSELVISLLISLIPTALSLIIMIIKNRPKK